MSEANKKAGLMGDPFLNSKTAPCLVLGVPSNANQQDAVTAFALRSRKVKSGISTAFSIEDLTASLSEIESTFREGSATIRFAIPCNYEVIQYDKTFQAGGITYDYKSDFSNLQSNEISNDQLPAAGFVFLGAALKELLEWNWDVAANCARESLRVSKLEDLRDEALNVLAAAFAMQGDAGRALDALKKAVEGQWNISLQTNLALVATELDPSLAIEHMKYIVGGAELISERIMATRMAIQLWKKVQGNETGSDDLDNFSPLPRPLLASIYLLLEDPAISEEDFFELGLFLARVDSEHFRTTSNLQRSKYSRSLSAQAMTVRAEGFAEFAERLGGIAAQDSGRLKPWIHEQLDSMVGSINSVLVEADSSNSFATHLAFAMIDGGLDRSTFHRIAMRPLLIQQLEDMLETNSKPSEKFIKWHNQATRAIRSGEAELTPEQVEILNNLQERAGNVLAFMFHRALLAQGGEIERAEQQIRQRMTGFFNRMSADKIELKRVATQIRDACSVAVKTYDHVIPLASVSELVDDMKGVRQAIQNINNSLFQYI